ncbi:prenyltransferase/squalene oxidase repeat-containing protein [Saccharopolyspora sp. NPDC050389]|uniref:prenyltransferase/squalene oxidase repeat-containing protein n=1 Tax=Saccharopolyspora sp. NPDC050389 TaxID=3155516 RepID=UPI003411E181
MTRELSTTDRLEQAIHAAEQVLLGAAGVGSWPNPRRAAVSGAAGAVLALHFADADRSADLIAGGVAWLLRVQNPDGGWGTLEGFPSDFVATAMATAALHLAAGSDGADSVSRARGWIDRRGGVAGLDDPMMGQLCGLVLSIAGLQDANRLRRVPVELVLLPAALRRRLLSYLTPPFLALSFMQSRQRKHNPLARAIDRLARPVAARLLEAFDQQEGGVGSYGGDPWLTGLVCTALTRAGAAPELARRSVEYLRMTAQPGGSWHLIHGVEAERVEVTGMAFSVHGLALAGHSADPRLLRARSWLAGCQQLEPSEVYASPAGAWAWTGRKGWPNALETVLVLRILVADVELDPDTERIMRRGIAWLMAQQDKRGSWSTFVRNTLVPLDGPCPFITALAIEILHSVGVATSDPPIRRALRWLERHQAPNGSFEARWHRGGVPATAAVVHALTKLGMRGHPVAAKARDWLLAAQLDDGSWSTGRGDQDGTPDETGHATRALVACGEHEAARHGAEWLVAAQQPDGRWEPGQTCIYIRDYVHYSDPLIAQGLAIGALAAYREVGNG